MNLMQNKKAWFSDAIFVDHVLELRKSNQRGEGLNKDWDPGSMGKMTEKAGVPEIAEGMIQGVETVGNALRNPHLAAPALALAATGAFQAGKKVFQGAKNVAGKVRDAMKTKPLSPEEDGPFPPGIAPINRDLAVRRESRRRRNSQEDRSG